MLQRIVRGRSATLTHTFYSDATPTDPVPDTTTVTIVRADGTAIVTGASATEAGTGAVTYTVTPTQTALLDRWTVTWTATFGGQAQSFIDTVEVAGDTIFNIVEARALAALSNTTTYPTASIVTMRTTVEDAIEAEYGTALVPRYKRAKLSGDGSTLLALTTPVRAVRDILISGTALDSTTLNALYVQDGYLSGYTWPAGVGNIVVGYEYGLDMPPGRVRQDAVRLARQWLVTGPIDDRALGAASPDGNFSFGLATPGRAGAIFGLPDLDAVIMSSPYRLGVA